MQLRESSLDPPERIPCRAETDNKNSSAALQTAKQVGARAAAVFHGKDDGGAGHDGPDGDGQKWPDSRHISEERADRLADGPSAGCEKEKIKDSF